MAKRKVKEAKEEPTAPQVQRRYVSPNRIAVREAQGWKRVEGAIPLRSGSVLMEKV
jgi:hypothetical protein